MIWNLRWYTVSRRAEDLAAGSLLNLSSWYFSASNSFEAIDGQQLSIFVRPGLGIFIPQKIQFQKLQILSIN